MTTNKQLLQHQTYLVWTNGWKFKLYIYAITYKYPMCRNTRTVIMIFRQNNTTKSIISAATLFHRGGREYKDPTEKDIN